MMKEQSISLENWDIRHGAQVDWMPWGSQDNARVKILGEADGYTIALIQADAGHQTAPHDHTHSEFFYLLDGVIRNQGKKMNAGDGYAAAIGSVHTDFEVQAPAVFLVIFRL